MATWSVLSGVPNPLFDSNGDPFSGAVLKAFLPGTTTSTSIAIDSAGSSPQSSITFNAEGQLEVTGSEILPYIDRESKWGIFANAVDAAANTPFYMGPFDNVEKVLDGLITINRSFDNVAAMVASTNLSAAGTVSTAGQFTAGGGGGGTYFTKTTAQAASDGDVIDEIRNITLANDLVAILQENAALTVETYGKTFDQDTGYAESLGRFIYGQEYFYAVQKAIFDNEAGATFTQYIHSGDSTTFGDNAEGFNPAVCFQWLAENLGLPSQNINEGHSGDSTVTWNSTHVDSDISTYPDMDCYLARWGINDGSEHGDPDTFETALRAGLAKLRAFKDSGSLTIVLMAPNTVFAVASNRDAAWLESIQWRIRQAARDFECVFIDTYAIWRDSKNAAGKWMDDVAGDAIHPGKELNASIYAELARWIYEPSAALRLNTNRFSNVLSALFTPLAATPPNEYHVGDSYFRATIANGWPLEGAAYTQKTADNIVLQENVEFSDAGLQRRQWRVGDPLANTFSAWREISQGSTTEVITASAGFNQPASAKAKLIKNVDSIVSDGYLEQTVAGVVIGGTAIGTVSAGFRPTGDTVFTAGTAWDGVTTFSLVQIGLNVSGTISVTNTTGANVKRIYPNFAFSVLP